jgi:hypothetical protein
VSARAPFSRSAIIALVAGGFALFVALLFLMGRGEAPLADTQNGGAHAAGNGLTGYAGFARLLEASGYRIRRSRSPTGLETRGILVLTPPVASDPAMIGNILEQRRNLGPTLVILPKWRASLPPGNLPPEASARFKRGWVVLSGAEAAAWPAQVLAPFTITHHITDAASAASLPRWQGLGLAGSLPTPALGHATGDGTHQVLIADSAGRALALKTGLEPIGPAPASYPVIFLAEPDLANNYGLADPARAAAALALVRSLSPEDTPGRVTFDMTLNGFGGAENLLTLAFRPPFLAATLCLILALAIVFWRALMRFGPAASPAPASAFGKRQLVENGASLILRARRWSLLATAYAAATERRLARSLGLARHDRASLDTALAMRAPGEEPFTPRAARLEAATTPDTILSAARALDTLPRKLT